MNLENIKSNPLINYWLSHKDVIDLLVESWHNGKVGLDCELHELLGLTLEEYAYAMNSDYFDNSDSYIDFMDYVTRNAVEE